MKGKWKGRKGRGGGEKKGEGVMEGRWEEGTATETSHRKILNFRETASNEVYFSISKSPPSE